MRETESGIQPMQPFLAFLRKTGEHNPWMFDHLQKLTSRSPKETSAGDTGFSSARVGAQQRALSWITPFENFYFPI